MGKFKFAVITAAATIAFGAGSAIAMTLYASTQCSEGNAINGIEVTDVTGDNGGATECWGTFDGNDDKNAGFMIDGHQYDFVAKQNINDDGTLDPDADNEDIGLTIGDDLPASSGTWAFDEGALDNDFLIVLKAANSPGFAAWLFSGDDNDSFSGDWLVAWTTGGGSIPDLSHLSIYEKVCVGVDCDPGTGPKIPLPAGMPLMLTAIGIGAYMKRRARKSA